MESRYSQTEREALAIRWACERLHSYLAGATFTVITDHKPLLGIFNKKSSKSPIRIERWVLFLQSYDFTVVYRPGETNPNDYASRHPLKCASEDIIQSTKPEAKVNLIVTECMPDAISLEDVNKATSLHEELQKIKLAVETGKMNELYNDPKMTRYKKVMNEFSVVDGIVLKGRKIVIPKSLQKRIVKLGHEGHQIRCTHKLRIT